MAPTNASLSTSDGSMARWKNPVDESPPFSIVREVLILVSWVERSIFRETSLMTSLGLTSFFARVKDARSKAARAARRTDTRFILRWKRILKDYVESPQWVQRKTRKAEPALDCYGAAGLPKRYFSYQSFAFRSGFFDQSTK